MPAAGNPAATKKPIRDGNQKTQVQNDIDHPTGHSYEYHGLYILWEELDEIPNLEPSIVISISPSTVGFACAQPRLCQPHLVHFATGAGLRQDMQFPCIPQLLTEFGTHQESEMAKTGATWH